MTVTRKFKCGQCPDGIVRKLIKTTQTQINVTMKNCDKCKAFYGIKKVAELVQIKSN